MKTRLFYSICSLALLLSASWVQAASVSPNSIEIIGSRGGTIDSVVTILNTGASEQSYFLDVLPFEPSDESGTPQFAPKDSDPQGFASWIAFSVSEIAIPAQTKVEVPFQVIVPDDISSGGYYAAVTVSTTPSEVVATNGATIEAKTAVLVFLTVEGETVEKLGLLDFMLERDDASHPFGLFSYRLQNQGNVHVTPVGVIRIRGMFGQTVRTFNANEAEGRVLPDSTRTFTVSYQPVEGSWIARAGDQLAHLAFGPMTAELSLGYGLDNTIQASWSLWAIPYELINLLLLMVVVIGGVSMLGSLRKRNTK